MTISLRKSPSTVLPFATFYWNPICIGTSMSSGATLYDTAWQQNYDIFLGKDRNLYFIYITDDNVLLLHQNYNPLLLYYFLQEAHENSPKQSRASPMAMSYFFINTAIYYFSVSSSKKHKTITSVLLALRNTKARSKPITSGLAVSFIKTYSDPRNKNPRKHPPSSLTVAS